MTGLDEMHPVTTGVRMYIAPVQRDPISHTEFDGIQAASFDAEAPPEPWLDLGRVENFKRSAADEATGVHSGAESVVIAQFRKKLEAHVSFTFRSWGRLQIAVAGGGVLWNVLDDAVPGAAVWPGSEAKRIALAENDAANFRAGDIVVVDLDHLGVSGYVGLGLPAAYVSPDSVMLAGSDYIRRVSNNVATIKAVNGATLELESPLPGGAPPLAASVKRVLGFESREGGLFRQQWSALFVEETVMGGRIFYYYPRLESQAPNREKSAAIAGDYRALLLDADLVALPTTDVRDGATALCYRIYLPPSDSAAALR